MCGAYWHPLYAFVRRQGHGPEDAQDLTQEFFHHLLDKDALTGVDPSKGRFRSFLLASIRISWPTTGTGSAPKSAAVEHPCGRSMTNPAKSITGRNRGNPVARQAVRPPMGGNAAGQVLIRLREDWNARDKLQRFDTLKAFLVEPRGEVSCGDVAAHLGITVPALRSMLHRLRQSYRQIFTQEISTRWHRRNEIRHLLKGPERLRKRFRTGGEEILLS